MSSYWKKRVTDNVNKINENTEKILKELKKTNEEVITGINESIKDFYAKYKPDTEGYASLKTWLTQEELNKQRERYARLTAKATSETNKTNLESLSAAVKLNREKIINSELNYYIEEMATKQSLIKTRVIESSIKEANNLMGYSFEKLSPYQLESLKRTVFDPSSYSDAIWDNKEKLAKNLQNTVTRGFIIGESVTKMSEMLTNTVESTQSAAERIIRTESALVANQSHLKLFEKAGTKYFEFMAHLDSRTSDICSAMDGTRHRVDKAMVGVNVPPLHPNCRSVVVALMDEDVVSQNENMVEQSTKFIIGDSNDQAIKAKKITNKDLKELGYANFTEAETTMINTFNTLIKDASPTVYMPETRLLNFLTTGKLKSADRTNFEKDLGLIRNGESPIYGVLETEHDKPLDIRRYGDIRVILNDNVKNRSTFTTGDTINSMGVVLPSKVTDPKIVSFSRILDKKDTEEVKAMSDLATRAQMVYKYVELQIYKGVDIKDVYMVQFKRKPSKHLQEMLERLKIQWRVNK